MAQGHGDDDIEALARRLAAHPDYRVLKRLAPVDCFHDPTASDPATVRVGVVVDVETTGLDREADRIIELAVQRFRFRSAGAYRSGRHAARVARGSRPPAVA